MIAWCPTCDVVHELTAACPRPRPIEPPPVTWMQMADLIRDADFRLTDNHVNCRCVIAGPKCGICGAYTVQNAAGALYCHRCDRVPA